MASAKFLEEALSTDVDESAVSAIVGSLETQLVTSTPSVSHQQGSTVILNQNHINSAISNGATVPSQKHEGVVANGEPMNIIHNSDAVNANKPITINSSSSSSNITNSNNSDVVSAVAAAAAASSSSSIPNNLQQQTQVVGGGTTTTTYITEGSSNITQTTNISKSNEAVKLIYPQGNQSITSAGPIITNRVAFPAQTVVPNGNIGLSPLTPQTVLQTATSNVQSVQNKQQQQQHLQQQHQQQQIVIKTSGNPTGAPGLVTVPMSVASSIQQQQHGNNVCSSAAGANIQNVMTLAKPITQTVVSTQNIVPTPQTAILPGNVQILNVQNVRPGVPGPQPQKAVQSRVVLSAPQMVGARPGQPQITLQSLQGLQPGQQGHLLLKTENGQYQLLRVGPAPAAPGAGLPTNQTPVGAAAGTTTYRLQTVPAVSRLNTQFTGPPLTLRKTIVQQQNSVAPTPASSPAPVQQVQQQQTVSTVTAASTVSVAQSTTSFPVQRQNLDNTKEKCRKFLANLLELSSREPKSVERNVRTLIQELIDCKVEPEEFCDRLERLLNASPQPCLIGFLKKSLPLLRQSLVTKELTIDGIRPPPANVVYSIQNSTPTIQTQIRPQAAPTQVRIVAPNTAAVVRPGQTIQQRLVTPVRGQSPQPRMIATSALRPQIPNSTSPVIVSTSQPPALHPVFPQSVNQMRTTVNVVRQPLQVRATTTTPGGGAIKQTTAIRTTTPIQVKPAISSMKQAQASHKPIVPSMQPKPTAKEKEKKTFSSAGYTGDDDINDVAAMGGVNLAEETQRILGSTEFVGTQIRSCKDEVFLHLSPLQAKIKQVTQKHGLDEPSNDVAALISHAAQEYLKNICEKLAVITDHRTDILKNDPKYEVSQDVKGQLKFLEDLDRAERKRHEEYEREILLRAAKSRSKSEDPEQAKLKAKAKEMQRVELEELRQREANATALQAIGPRKKPKLDGDSTAGTSQNSVGVGGSGPSRGQLPLRQRMKKVTLRDLLFYMETEKETCRSTLLYKSYLK